MDLMHLYRSRSATAKSVVHQHCTVLQYTIHPPQERDFIDRVSWRCPSSCVHSWHGQDWNSLSYPVLREDREQSMAAGATRWISSYESILGVVPYAPGSSHLPDNRLQKAIETQVHLLGVLEMELVG
jgi:hypothetical protein